MKLVLHRDRRPSTLTTYCVIDNVDVERLNGAASLKDTPFNNATFTFVDDNTLAIRGIAFSASEDWDLSVLAPLYRLVVDIIPPEGKEPLSYTRANGDIWMVTPPDFRSASLVQR